MYSSNGKLAWVCFKSCSINSSPSNAVEVNDKNADSNDLEDYLEDDSDESEEEDDNDDDDKTGHDEDEEQIDELIEEFVNRQLMIKLS